MGTRELVTLQFGHFSNFISTHYWNSHFKRINEKNDVDCNYINKLFRESASTGQAVPRTVCFDIKTKLESLKRDGSFDETNRDMDTEVKNEPSDIDCVVYSETALERNEFVQHILENRDLKVSEKYNLDENVKSWSDFLTYKLHDQSMQLLSENYKNGDDFIYFGMGNREYSSLRDDFEDRLHFWTEECDYMEGFQLFIDLHNGYTGLASKVLEDLSDDYGRKSKLCYLNWKYVPDVTFAEKEYHYLNVALTLQSMKQFSSLSVLQSTEQYLLKPTSCPVKIPYINYKHDLPYHTSAILAAAIDSTTIPLYDSKTRSSLSEICYKVNYGNWCVAGSAFGIPFDLRKKESNLMNYFLSNSGFYGNGITSLFPYASKISFVPSSHMLVLQGIPLNSTCPTNIDSKIFQRLDVNTNIFNRGPFSVLEFFNDRYYPDEETVSTLFYSEQKMRTELPFPSIIQNTDTETNLKPIEVPTFSSLYTSPQFYDFFSEVLNGVKGLNLHKHHALEELGLDQDTLIELKEEIISIAQAYNREKAFDEL